MVLFDKRRVFNCILLKVTQADTNDIRFHNNQIYYPIHCIQGTDLAEVIVFYDHFEEIIVKNTQYLIIFLDGKRMYSKY